MFGKKESCKRLFSLLITWRSHSSGIKGFRILRARRIWILMNSLSFVLRWISLKFSLPIISMCSIVYLFQEHAFHLWLLPTRMAQQPQIECHNAKEMRGEAITHIFEIGIRLDTWSCKCPTDTELWCWRGLLLHPKLLLRSSLNRTPWLPPNLLTLPRPEVL